MGNHFFYGCITLDGVRKFCGLYGKYIDYHLYLANFFAIPAIILMVMELKSKKNSSYIG